MTEVKHLRCDRCNDDILIVSGKTPTIAERGWVQVWRSADLSRLDFCPNCWSLILAAADRP